MVRPNNSLDPNSQPWARSIEQDIADIKFAAATAATANGNLFATINNSLRLLGEQVAQQISVDGGTNRLNDFALSEASTLTNAASLTFTKPSWANRAVVTAIASGYLVATDLYHLPNIGVYIDGATNGHIDMARVDAASAVPYSMSIGNTIKLDPCPDTFVCKTAFYIVGTSYYYTGEPNRISNISATVIYTK